MSLDRQLTVPRLKALAGYAFERGERYWRQQQVTSCTRDGEMLAGLVLGSRPRPYQVQVTAGARGLESDCTCPMGAGFCKHAVALALHWLHRDEVTAQPEVGPSFATRAELMAWAEDHDVIDALGTSAQRLVGELGGVEHVRQLGYMLGRLALRDVASRDVAARYFGGAAVVIAAAARRVLEGAAASVRDGIAEEKAARRTWQGLGAKLVTARAAIRAEAAPRGRAARAAGTWRFDSDQVAVLWTDPDRSVFSGQSLPIGVTLTCPGGGELLLACTCDPKHARCTHALALIDATLDVLADPARAEQARELETELSRPGWSRALAELARRGAVVAAPRPVVEVWWEIEQGYAGLAIRPIVKKLTKRGTLTAGARTSARKLLDEHRAQLSEQDRRVAEQVVASEVDGRGGLQWRAFVELVGHPRVIGAESESRISVARATLGFTAVSHGDAIRLQPALDGEPVSPRLVAALLEAFEPGESIISFHVEGLCLVIEAADDARYLWHVLERHGDVFPPESHGELLERLAQLEPTLPVSVPPVLKGRELPGELVVVVRARLLADATLELEAFVRPGPDAPLFSPSSGPKDVLLQRGGERGYVRRRLDEEVPHVRGMLARLPLEGADEGPPWCFRLAGDAALELVQALEAPPPGIEAEWIEVRPAIVGTAQLPALRVQVEKRRDWFGIVGELKVETGRLELAVLLDAARRQQRFVRLGERRWIELSEALRERLVAIADQTFATRDRLELSPGAVPAIRALADAGAEVETAPAWQALTERLAASRRLRPKPPAGLKATLRDYQIEGHAWLSRLAAWGAGACLADDMGLGKTVQAIAVLLDRSKLGPALVLAPTSVALNWVAELARFAPGLRPVIYGEQADRAACVAGLGKGDVLIVSYGLLVRDAELLAGNAFGTLVLDEAQALKNPTTRRAKAARKLDAQFRIALSGTPFENHLGELWSLFSIVFPGLLGSWEQFRERFAGPIERIKSPEASAALSRVIRPFLLRRTKQEVAKELPARSEIEVPIALGKDEWALYEDARLAAVAELSKQGKGVRDEQRRFQILAALTRLRLLASHPKLYDPRSPVASSKLRRLVELLEELRSEGHRALVFSQFTSHLTIVREELEAAGFHALYLDGSTPARERARLIDAFQGGEAELFLISLKAGGTGINLTAADYVIHLDPWWNPAVEDQATDRAHRIGQTRPVTVYRLIARGTIEEQILQLHGDKRALVAGVLEGTDVAARLSTKDLLGLLAAGSRPIAEA